MTTGGPVSGWSARHRWLVVAVALCTVAAPLGAQSLSDIVADHGLRAVDPPTPATDFTLPMLDGSQVALSEFGGQWVLLTFFATWCGPCRSEMPSLQRLHEARHQQGLVVLGVSTDAQQAPLGGFVDSLGLTFPILWDQGGRVARSYRATSIPLSYLVDPTGLVVAVSRGARDWSRATAMVDALLAAEPADAEAAAQYAAADAPLELPATYDPPTADVILSQRQVAVGRPFDLDVHLRWAGSFEDYLPHPPQVMLPEGVTEEGMTASSTTAQGSSVVTYTFTFAAHETGSFDLDPVELRYTPRGESQPLIARVEGPTVEVRPQTVAGFRPWVLGLVLCGVVLAFSVGGLLIRRSAARSRRVVPIESSYQRLRARFDEARATRLRGDSAACVVILAELGGELGLTDGGGIEGLDEVVEQARYGGQAPPSEDLDQLIRRVERRLETLRPDPEKSDREAIRLADSSKEEQ